MEFSGGKGLEGSQAMASCIGEGLERYFSSGKFITQETVISASYTQLISMKKNAVNPILFFGLPFNFDFYSLEKPDYYSDYNDELIIEWALGKNLSTNEKILIPANMVYCPYDHSDSNIFSATSTNGLSAGGNMTEAILQGCLELIERDAFWFAARTGLGIVDFQHIESLFRTDLYPDLKFSFMLLFTEFNFPVAQVVIENKNSELPKTSRGTGCAFNIEKAFNRAFSEALQMFYSQRFTLETDEKDLISDMDMRWIWSSGKSMEVFPYFFDPTINLSSSKYAHSEKNFSNVDAALDFLKSRLNELQLNLICFPLCDNQGSFSVVRTFLSQISCFDQLYFRNNSRLNYLSKKYFEQELKIKYNKSLFM